MILNTKLKDINFTKLTPWIKEVTTLRCPGGTLGMSLFRDEKDIPLSMTSGKVLKKDQLLGLKEVQDKHDLDIIWMVNMNDTLKNQLQLLIDLRNQGFNIKAIEYGNEFYLRKFEQGDTSKNGVAKVITVRSYLKMLSEWIPVIELEFPFNEYDHIIIGCSHNSTDHKRDIERKEWNDTLRSVLKNNELSKKLSVSYHLYAGGHRRLSPSNGEEHILDFINFDFLNDLRDVTSGKVFITEANYEIEDESEEYLSKAKEFWQSLYKSLQPQDQFGLHVLYSPFKNTPYNFYGKEGRTILGDNLEEWITAVTEQTIEEPVLVDFKSDYHRLSFIFRQVYKLSNGTIGKTNWKFRWGWSSHITEEHKGLTLTELEKLNLL